MVLDNASEADLNKKGKNLQRLSRWIIDRWIEFGVQGLEGVPDDAKSMNMTGYVSRQPGSNTADTGHSAGLHVRNKVPQGFNVEFQ